MYFKMVKSTLVCTNKNLAVVERCCKDTDKFGHLLGGFRVFYDICEYQDGEIGECLKSFVTFGAAEEWVKNGQNH